MTLAQRLAGPDGLVTCSCGCRVIPSYACRFELEEGPALVCRSCCPYCGNIDGRRDLARAASVRAAAAAYRPVVV